MTALSTLSKFFLTALFLMTCYLASGQINFQQPLSIDAAGNNPDPTAILDLQSTDKGILIPRMTSTQRTAITGTEGLMVYDTVTDSFWYHDGSNWQEIGQGGASGGAFEILDGVVRSTGDHMEDFVFGRDALPANGEDIDEEHFFFFDQSNRAFRGGYIDSEDWSPDSLGWISFAYGSEVKATGDRGATALGIGTQATGNFGATALGRSSKASGEGGATALGYFTAATGDNGATALGSYTEAIGDNGATALGYGTEASGEGGATALGNYTEAFGEYGATALGYETQATGDMGATALGRSTNALGNDGATALGFESVASGNNGATALGYETQAMGNDGATALGRSSKASGENGATALGHETEASGDYGATALGDYTEASGEEGATALGRHTTASGDYGATALGNSTEAKGDYGATALGYGTIASGDYGAMALGYITEASGDACTVVGRLNDPIVSAGTNVTDDSPLFIVGNGDFPLGIGGRSNALVVRKDGRIHANGPSFIYGRHDLPEDGETVQDTFIFFDREKGAFRGGAIENDDWSPDSLGTYSFGYGNEVLASGDDGATALGYFTKATGDYGATAIGYYTEAIGRRGATAQGYYTEATGNRGATALGRSTQATGDDGATALGRITQATGDGGATALGYYSTSSGDDGATALGNNTIANGNSSIAVGMFNNTLVASGTAVTEDSPILIVGNGDNDSNRSNALVIRKDGSFQGFGKSMMFGAYEPPISFQIYDDDLFFYDDEKAALKVGRFQSYGGPGGSWFPAPLGEASVAIGYNCLANGFASVSLGRETTADGGVSIAAGNYSNANANYSVAMGDHLIANSVSSTVFGMYNDSLVATTILSAPNDPIFMIGNGDDDDNRSNALIVRKSGKVEVPDSLIVDGYMQVGNGINDRIYIGNDYIKDGGASIIRAGANFTPDGNNIYNLGGNSNRWKEVFAVEGMINTSDRRAKKNISNIKYGIDQIMSLRPVDYHWNKEEKTESKSLGLIAQEILEVIPEVVHVPEDQEELMGVNYAELVPVLIKAMQEQQEQMNAMSEQLQKQSFELYYLKNSIASKGNQIED